MPHEPSRRALLQAALAGIVAAFLDTRRALAPAGSVLDGGPWVAGAQDMALADAATVADCWGRRGLRVVVAVGDHRGSPSVESVRLWSENLRARGWQSPAASPDGALGGAFQWLRHPSTSRGEIRVTAALADDCLGGVEAVVLDTTVPEVIESMVRRALYPWPGFMWIGTRYLRVHRTPSRGEFEALRARVAHLLPPRPTRFQRPRAPVRAGPHRRHVLQTPALLALHAIGRLERGGVPPQPRLTDPDHRLWNSLRRKLGPADFVALLFHDAAQDFPVPFSHPRLLEQEDAAVAAALIEEATRPPEVATTEFLRQSARRLGRPDNNSLTRLPRIQPHERVLELAGTSGRGAAWLVGQHADLRFDANFVFHEDCVQDHVLIGLAAVECRSGRPELLSTAALRVVVQDGRTFDRVICHRGFDPSVRLAKELFPAEKVLWV